MLKRAYAVGIDVALRRYGVKEARRRAPWVDDDTMGDKMLRGVGGFMGGATANIAGGVAANHLFNQAVNSTPTVSAAAVAKRVSDSTGVRRHIPIETVSGLGNNAGYAPFAGLRARRTLPTALGAWRRLFRDGVDPRVFVGTSQLPEAILAHEFGHARNAENFHHMNTLMSNLARGIGTLSSPLATAWAAGQQDPTWIPSVGNALLHSPNLLEEGAANVRALSHMIREHGFGKGLAQSKALLPAMASYVIPAAVPAAVTGLRKLKRHIFDE